MNVLKARKSPSDINRHNPHNRHKRHYLGDDDFEECDKRKNYYLLNDERNYFLPWMFPWSLPSYFDSKEEYVIKYEDYKRLINDNNFIDNLINGLKILINSKRNTKGRGSIDCISHESKDSKKRPHPIDKQTQVYPSVHSESI